METITTSSLPRVTTFRLICASLMSLGVLLAARTASAAEVGITVHYGETADPVTEFFNAQPSNAETSFSKASSFSDFFWGTGGAGSFLMSFSTGGFLVAQGISLEADLRKPFMLGRLEYLRGITAFGEATSVDLRIALTLSKPEVTEPVATLTLPLTIQTFREVIAGELFGTGGQIDLPATLPSQEFAGSGIKYRLRLIGFGSIDAAGKVTTVPSLVLAGGIEGDVITLADLFAVLEPICEPPPGTSPILDTIAGFGGTADTNCNEANKGLRNPVWGRYGRRPVLTFQSGERLAVTCNGDSYKLLYTPAEASEADEVGGCVFDGGCNFAAFYHTPGDDKTPGCLLSTIWISKDYFTNDKEPNPWTHEANESPELLDWAEWIFDAPNRKVTTNSYKWKYNISPETTVPFEFCAVGASAEGQLVQFKVLSDPPLGPETDALFAAVLADLAKLPPSGVPMSEDRSKRCDFNGDGRCDEADLQIFEAALGKCRDDVVGYNPRADVDASGCVDAVDRFHLFEADRDGDGVPDTADNCPGVFNPDQTDSVGDGMGDACRSNVIGDLNGDGIVDLDDLAIVLAARNTAATGPNDPRDLDHDGRITALDARKLMLQCALPKCAKP